MRVTIVKWYEHVKRTDFYNDGLLITFEDGRTERYVNPGDHDAIVVDAEPKPLDLAATLAAVDQIVQKAQTDS